MRSLNPKGGLPGARAAESLGAKLKKAGRMSKDKPEKKGK
jgi:hypothetical protein